MFLSEWVAPRKNDDAYGIYPDSWVTYARNQCPVDSLLFGQRGDRIALSICGFVVLADRHPLPQLGHAPFHFLSCQPGTLLAPLD